MDAKIYLVFSLVTMLLVQQTPVCEGNWLQDLMARFGTFGKAKDAHVEVYGNDGSPSTQPLPPQQQPRPTEKNKGSWTHELIAAAAGFEAMRVYERHQAKQKGQPPNHSVVKGILAGLAAAAVDRLIETKGLDWIDAQRAKQGAAQTAESMVEQVERGNGNNQNAGYSQSLGGNQQSEGENQAGGRGGHGNRGRNQGDGDAYDSLAYQMGTTSAGEFR